MCFRSGLRSCALQLILDLSSSWSTVRQRTSYSRSAPITPYKGEETSPTETRGPLSLCTSNDVACAQASDRRIWGLGSSRGSHDARVGAEHGSVQELDGEVELSSSDHRDLDHVSVCVCVTRLLCRRFPGSTEHLVMNEQTFTPHNARSHKLQTQLNLIHPEIFPQLKLYKSKVQQHSLLVL